MHQGGTYIWVGKEAGQTEALELQEGDHSWDDAWNVPIGNNWFRELRRRGNLVFQEKKIILKGKERPLK
jgi:hypothetical protein